MVAVIKYTEQDADGIYTTQPWKLMIDGQIKHEAGTCIQCQGVAMRRYKLKLDQITVQ